MNFFIMQFFSSLLLLRFSLYLNILHRTSFSHTHNLFRSNTSVWGTTLHTDRETRCAWVWILVCHIKRRTQIEVLWEQNAGENVCTKKDEMTGDTGNCIIRSYITLTQQVWLGWSNQRERSGQGMWHVWDIWNSYKNVFGKDEESDHLEDLCVDVRITLNLS